MLRTREHGFTLVEMLVVVAVLAVLATFAVPKLFTAMNASRQAQVESDLRTIHEALEHHYLDHGNYPVKLKDLVTRGYLKPGANFRSPVSRYFYFYAVDNNTQVNPSQARNYVLGAPGKDAEEEIALRRSGPLPRGHRPDQRARAWVDSPLDATDALLNLFENETDEDPMGNVPGNLANFRTSCQSGSLVPCDLITN
ncbi:MAG TPA: prepilin-type N-terminal cleavage/methylation domain-containing protein [Symbiobacteriaceae bacterium]|nr:prepilin-type N-terminal cleavage/methylation domain-containing protein [Symbiobacteriaceae bacterium]